MKTKRKNPLVSVVVTTFNRKKLLKSTIDSILNQTFTDFEFIVVDNYSNYDFFAFIKSFGDDRLIAFQNKNDGIIAVNRNYGIKKAKGKYIAFCDDDDCWDFEKLSKQIPYLLENNVVGVGSLYSILGSEKSKFNTNKLIYLKFDDVIKSNRVALSSLIIRNKENYFFNEDKNLVGLEDWFFQLNLLYNTKNKIILLKDKLLFYRIHDQNYSVDANQLKRSFSIIDKYKNKIDNELYNTSKGKLYFSIGLQNLIIKQRKKSMINFAKSAYLVSGFYLKLRSSLMILFALLPLIIQQKLLSYLGKINN